jgi:hypothetical protein
LLAHSSGCGIPGLPSTNVRLGYNCITSTNALAYFPKKVLYKVSPFLFNHSRSGLNYCLLPLYSKFLFIVAQSRNTFKFLKSHFKSFFGVNIKILYLINKTFFHSFSGYFLFILYNVWDIFDAMKMKQKKVFLG